jgi:hypothetical protein
MTNTDITKAVAELDGWKKTEGNTLYKNGVWIIPDAEQFPKYLTSRDAIIPVIEKQDDTTQLKFMYHLRQIVAHDLLCEPKEVDTCDLVLSFATQLCEALLRATGKWKD